MSRKISLEEFGDILAEEFGDEMPNLDALPISYLREKLGLVFSRGENGKLDITQY
jgi:hypothetical protein